MACQCSAFRSGSRRADRAVARDRRPDGLGEDDVDGRIAFGVGKGVKGYVQALVSGLVNVFEHSAMGAAIGASATGARVFTASASQGLAFMQEGLCMAPGLRWRF